MRMWNVDPKLLCRQHLLGEHNENHSFVGTLNKKISIKGFIDKGLLEIHNLRKRHHELEIEMISRGYKHNSPLKEFEEITLGNVNSEENLKDLCKRCSSCRERILYNENKQ